MPSGTLPRSSTPSAVPREARLSAIAAYTPPCTMPIGWHTAGITGNRAGAVPDLDQLVDLEPDHAVEAVLDGEEPVFGALARPGSAIRWSRDR